MNKPISYDTICIITSRSIGSLPDVLLHEDAKRINLEVGERLLQIIAEASEDGKVEIVFGNDIKHYVDLLRQTTPSPLIVDSTNHLRFPLYGLTITLPPLTLALYMLYLQHPEGLYRKQVASPDIKKQLLTNYARTLGRPIDDAMRLTVEHLTDFSRTNCDKQMSTLRQHLTRALGEKAECYLPISKGHNTPRGLDFNRVKVVVASIDSADDSTPKNEVRIPNRSRWH